MREQRPYMLIGSPMCTHLVGGKLPTRLGRRTSRRCERLSVKLLPTSSSWSACTKSSTKLGATSCTSILFMPRHGSCEEWPSSWPGRAWNLPMEINVSTAQSSGGEPVSAIQSRNLLASSAIRPKYANSCREFARETADTARERVVATPYAAAFTPKMQRGIPEVSVVQSCRESRSS